MKPQTPYEQIEGRVLGKMTNYQTDFTQHDRKVIDQYFCMPFVLIVREMGTHLFTMNSYVECRIAYQKNMDGKSPYLFGEVANRTLAEHHLAQHLETINYLEKNYPDAEVFIYDGIKRVEIYDFETARECVREMRENTKCMNFIL